MTAPPHHPHHPHLAGAGPDDLYASPPVWDIGRPQAAFRALAEQGRIGGRVLDVGCGTGEHVLMCAALGLDATGIDLAGTALHIAETKSRDRGLTARFLRHDALHLPDLGETFDTVLDCGLFHILGDPERTDYTGDYTGGLRAALRRGGHYLMLGLSDAEPGFNGGRMRHLTRQEVADAFTAGWQVEAIEPATIEITTDPSGVRAWLAVITRV